MSSSAEVVCPCIKRTRLLELSAMHPLSGRATDIVLSVGRASVILFEMRKSS